MEISLFLAKVLGLFFSLSTLIILLRYKEHLRIESEAAGNAVYVVSSGFFFLLAGIMLVVSHTLWTGDWRLIITILSWMIFMKGLLRILFPSGVKRLVEKKNSSGYSWLGEIISFFIGIFLVYKGFF